MNSCFPRDSLRSGGAHVFFRAKTTPRMLGLNDYQFLYNFYWATKTARRIEALLELLLARGKQSDCEKPAPDQSGRAQKKKNHQHVMVFDNI